MGMSDTGSNDFLGFAGQGGDEPGTGDVDTNPVQTPRDLLCEADIAAYRQVSDWRGAWMIFHCWAVIFLTWAAVVYWTNPLTIFLGILIIGTRQLGLFILSHDGAHYTLFNNKKLNDWASEWLLSRAQLGAGIGSYRRYHMKHHRFTQQAQDPDLALSKPFPISRASFRRKAIRDLTGQTGIKQYGAGIREAFKDGFAQGVARLGPNLLINLVFLAGFAYVGKWYLYFLLWWVPALTWNRFVTRLRNIGEHAARARQRRPAAQHAHHPRQLARTRVHRAVFRQLPPRAPFVGERALLPPAAPAPAARRRRARAAHGDSAELPGDAESGGAGVAASVGPAGRCAL